MGSLAEKTAAQAPTFHHLPIEYGPLNSSVLAITQDADGYMWFGVRDGLIRYDGIHFRKFESRNGTKNALPVYYISTLFSDSRKNLWIGASDGLLRYNCKTGVFEDVLIYNSRPFFVNAIFEDKKGRIWIGVGGGLHLLQNPDSKDFRTFGTKEGLSGDLVLSVKEDKNGNIWVGTNNGLTKLTEQNGQFRLQSFRSTDGANSSAIHANYITSLAIDSNNRLWIATQHDGISLYDPGTGKFRPIKHESSDPKSLVNNNIRKVIYTRQGKIWVGTQEGISIIDPVSMQISSHQYEASNDKTLSQNSVHGLFEDANGTVWIGTYYGGINKVYPQKTKFNVWKTNGSSNSLSTNVISSIIEDDQANLWIGTEGGGLNFYNRQAKTFSVFKNKIDDPASIGSNLVKIVFMDRDKNIWAGTHGGGLNVLDRKSGKFLRYLFNEKDPASLNSEVLSIAEDLQGRLWVATNVGFKLFRRTGMNLEPLDIASTLEGFPDITVQAFFRDSRGAIWIRANQGLYRANGSSVQQIDASLFFTSLNEDNEGNVWAGLNSGNLIKWDPKTGKVSRYGGKEGLPATYVLSILPDQQGTLWLGTEKGLLRYNPENKALRRYTTSDGLASNEFNYHAYLKARDGRLFFGGFNGITHFFPDSIEANNTVAPLVFTGLKLYNEEVLPGDKSGLLSQEIGSVEALSFDHDQSAFTLEFALLNFIKSEKNRYAYKLEGVDRAWNETTTPAATYVKLPPGSYTFLVKGANNDGVWSTPVAMRIMIHPPFWRTWWAYLFYLVAAAAILFFVTRFFFLRELLKKEDALHQVKLNFFTNISHEIRTHLTLIMTPVDQLLTANNQDAYGQEHLNKVKKNANRLLRLVNELMDFRKAETENMKLTVRRNNCIPFILDIISSFEELSAEKNIHTSFVHQAEDVPLYFDPVQMEKVFFNLLANAYKFTPRGGKIQVRLEQTDADVSVSISNNGKGIAPEFLGKLFTNFYQVPDHKQNTGYGIGLALSKNIVELHGGTIEVTSTTAQDDVSGQTTFTVKLPKGNVHFSDADLSNIATNDQVQDQPVIDGIEAAQMATTAVEAAATRKDHTILIVEDNAELRNILKEILSRNYHVLESEHGLDGWQTATEHLPDLVISDVMMPQMDGFALCAKLKTDERTSHIPVILLTAKSTQSDQLSGLETGADVYLTKPFNNRILALTVRNLLAAREKTRQKFSRDLATVSPEPVTASTIIASQPYTGVDKEFLQKVTDLVYENLDNPDFGVEMLSRKVAMSPPILYKKIKAVTNMSVNEFVKSLRLKKAAELLLQKELTIYQVAYTVGYEDRKYFSREFKKQFGVNPSEYAGAPGNLQE